MLNTLVSVSYRNRKGSILTKSTEVLLDSFNTRQHNTRVIGCLKALQAKPSQKEHAPIHMDRAAVEVKSFKFLGLNITDNVKWSTRTECGEGGPTAAVQLQKAEEISLGP